MLQKYRCSPSVKVNSCPQSAHVSLFSVNTIFIVSLLSLGTGNHLPGSFFPLIFHPGFLFSNTSGRFVVRMSSIRITNLRYRSVSSTLPNSEKRNVYDFPLLPDDGISLPFLTSSETYCLLQPRAFMTTSVVISKYSPYITLY